MCVNLCAKIRPAIHEPQVRTEDVSASKTVCSRLAADSVVHSTADAVIDTFNYTT